MSGEYVRLCRRVPGYRCLSFCSHYDRATHKCRLYPTPPSRWGRDAEVIEIPRDEWERGEYGSGLMSCDDYVGTNVGEPSKHRPTHAPRVPDMSGASIAELNQALMDLWEQEQE